MAFNSAGPTNDISLIVGTRLKEELSSISAPWFATILVALLALSLLSMSKKPTSISNFPLVNPKKFYDLGGIRAKLTFIFSARHLLALGVRTGRPFRLLTDLGEMIVLPARYANEIRSDPRLSFSEVIVQVSCARSNISMVQAHELMNSPRLFRTFTRITQALRVFVRVPQMPISVVMWQMAPSLTL